jgi:hypothetical protein
MCAPRGQPLSGKQNVPLDSAGGFKLEPAQHVNSRWDAAQPGSQRTKKTCLWGAEFDHIGPQTADQEPEPHQRYKICQRCDAATDGDGNGANPFKRSSSSEQHSRTGNHGYIETRDAKGAEPAAKHQASFMARDAHKNALLPGARRRSERLQLENCR